MLTSLGVIIGSASVVLVVTVALTSRKFVLSQIEATGANLVWGELVQRPDKAPPRSYEMTVDDIEAAKSILHVVAVAGTSEHPMATTVDGVDRAVTLVGLTDGYQTIRTLLIVRWRYFDAGDMEMRSKVCLITTQLAERIFAQENPVGRSEEHTSELQSRLHLVCRLLLEKKKKQTTTLHSATPHASPLLAYTI